jgi:hypothetical protein
MFKLEAENSHHFVWAYYRGSTVLLIWKGLASTKLIPSNWFRWLILKSLLECDKCESVINSSLSAKFRRVIDCHQPPFGWI